MNQPKVDPADCLPLREDILAIDSRKDPFPLPADFPRHLIDPEDMDELQDWWTSTVTAFLERLRHALRVHAHTHPNLDNFIQNAVVLGNMLALHPALSGTLSSLSNTKPFSFNTLQAHRAAILDILSGKGQPIPLRPDVLSPKQLAVAFPALDFAAIPARAISQGHRNPRCLIVPFAGRVNLADQWDTVVSISLYPKLSATLDLTADGRDAVRISWHDKVKSPRKPKKSTPKK
ncbi:MAG: hypothetical protein Q3986_06435 [Akkermansia sp.]|nr:hypothetical protein [Akkermansia sp.]